MKKQCYIEMAEEWESGGLNSHIVLTFHALYCFQIEKIAE